jgi:hypothetical protein
MIGNKSSLIEELMQRKLKMHSPLHKMQHDVRISRKGQNENQPTFRTPSVGGGLANMGKNFMPKITSEF